MLCLRAVEPHWFRICDANSVCEDLRCCADGSVGGHEAGVESVGLVGHDVLDGDAGVVESRLNNGVVLFKCC